MFCFCFDESWELGRLCEPKDEKFEPNSYEDEARFPLPREAGVHLGAVSIPLQPPHAQFWFHPNVLGTQIWLKSSIG